jgi:hypothetical protein
MDEKYLKLVRYKAIAVRWQSTQGVSAVNPLVAFYNIHGRKGSILLPRTPYET